MSSTKKKYATCSICVLSLKHFKVNPDELTPAHLKAYDQLVHHAACPSCQDKSRGRECDVCRMVNAGAWHAPSENEVSAPKGDVLRILDLDDGRRRGDPEKRPPVRDVIDPWQDEIDYEARRSWDSSRPAKRYTELERAIALELRRARKTGEQVTDADLGRQVGCTRARVGQVRKQFEPVERPLDRALQKPRKFRTRTERRLVEEDRVQLEAELDRLIAGNE